MLIWILFAPFHEGTDRRRCGVEDRDAMPFAHIPHAIPVRPVRRAFVQHAGGAIGEWSVHDVGVSRHPADIGGAPEHIVVLEVKHLLRRRCDTGQIAAGAMHDAFRFAGGARCVQNEQRILGIHHRRFALQRRFLHQPMPPCVAPVHHLRVRLLAHRTGATLHHNAVLDARRLAHRSIGVALERHHLTATESTVGRDEHTTLRVVDTITQ